MSKLNDFLLINSSEAMETYNACRKAGMSSSASLERTRYIQRITNDLSMPWSIENEDDDEVWVKLDKDSEGREIGKWTMQIERDDDSSMDDSDCYTEEDIEAFKNEAWQYHLVTVEYEAADGRTGIDSLGGIDAGFYWYTDEYPLNREQQVFAVALDYYELDANAKAEALAKPVPLSAHVDHILAAFPDVVPGRDVFYNQNGDEAIIAVNDDGASSYLISVNAENGDTSSATAEWETGYTC